jgi:NADPH:quinone reductase-like Zn-dependent oxidoreductase
MFTDDSQDLYVLSGRIDTKDSTSCLEFSGVVTRTGAGVSGFVPGDRVVAMAPNHFSTYECVPEWACCKLNDDEAYSVRQFPYSPV